MPTTSNPTTAVPAAKLVAASPVKGLGEGLLVAVVLVLFVPLVLFAPLVVRTKLAQVRRVVLELCTLMERLPRKAPIPYMVEA